MNSATFTPEIKKKRKNKRPGKRDRENLKTASGPEPEEAIDIPAKRARLPIEPIISSVSESSGSAFHWNFEVDYNDHFETPLEAFSDIIPCLEALASKLQPPKALKDLIVYDPYWCQGRMHSLLGSLGLLNVINDNRDFYADIAAEEAKMKKVTSGIAATRPESVPSGINRPPGLPAFDVLLTNPPYSGEHKARLLAFLTSPLAANKPFALLLPAYTAGKAYWRSYLTSNRALTTRTEDRGKSQSQNPPEHFQNESYLLPAASYQYSHPEGTGHDASPFYSAWFLGRFPALQMLRASQPKHLKYTMVATVSDLVTRGLVVEKRLNPKQRHKKRSQRQGDVSTSK